MEFKDYYKILQVDASAEAEVITAAYRRLAQKYHPDKNKSAGTTLRMQELTEAYNVLSDPDKRAKYDSVHSAHSAYRHVTYPDFYIYEESDGLRYGLLHDSWIHESPIAFPVADVESYLRVGNPLGAIFDSGWWTKSKYEREFASLLRDAINKRLSHIQDTSNESKLLLLLYRWLYTYGYVLSHYDESGIRNINTERNSSALETFNSGIESGITDLEELLRRFQQLHMPSPKEITLGIETLRKVRSINQARIQEIPVELEREKAEEERRKKEEEGRKPVRWLLLILLVLGVVYFLTKPPPVAKSPSDYSQRRSQQETAERRDRQEAEAQRKAQQKIEAQRRDQEKVAAQLRARERAETQRRYQQEAEAQRKAQEQRDREIAEAQKRAQERVEAQRKADERRARAQQAAQESQARAQQRAAANQRRAQQRAEANQRRDQQRAAANQRRDQQRAAANQRRAQ